MKQGETISKRKRNLMAVASNLGGVIIAATAVLMSLLDEARLRLPTITSPSAASSRLPIGFG